MATRCEVGNALIHSSLPNDPFGDGVTTGHLEFYDERYRPAFPLTSQSVYEQLQRIWNEPSAPALWKAGRITGWIEALCENGPQTFRRLIPQEREQMTVLQTH
jgi:hypothetical protein